MLEPEASPASRVSLAKGVPYQENYHPPAGSVVAFVRRWRVEEIDAPLGLRRVTLAVLSDEQTNKALLIEENTVGLAR